MNSRHKRVIWLVIALFFLSSCNQEPDLKARKTLPFTTLSTSPPQTPTGRGAVLTGTREAAAETDTPTEITPTPLPIKTQEITFKTGRFTIVGDLQVPGGEGKHPAIIMVHGDGGIDRDGYGTYQPLIASFLQAGYAVLSWDKPGTGSSTGALAQSADLLEERADILVAAVEFLQEQPSIDPERIGTWGISQAGYVIPLAIDKSDRLSFVILVGGPGVNSLDQMIYLIGQQFRCRGYLEQDAHKVENFFRQLYYADSYQEYRQAKEYLIRSPYALNFTGLEITPEGEWSPDVYSQWVYFDPIEVIEGMTIPMLVIFEERDTQVDPLQGAAAYEAALQKAGNQNYQIELFPDADHNIVLARTGCMEERDNRSMEDWVNYAPGYLELMAGWLRELSNYPP